MVHPIFKRDMVRVLDLTWQAIAPDVIGYIDEDDQSSIIEIVLDIDRLESYGGNPQAVETFRRMSYEKQRAFIKEHYGNFGY